MQTACLDVSRLQHYKTEVNKVIEVFAYDGGKYYFDLSCAMALFLVKEVFFMF